MSGNVPQDQEEEEFKEYLDKAGVLELLTVPSSRVTVFGNASQEQENEEFKEYLDKAGVLEFLTSALVKLYEEPVKPRDALEYLKNSIEGAKAEKEEIAKLTSENDDLKKKIDELENKEAELKEKIMEATTLSASETKDKMEEMGVADPPINTTGIDTNDIAMETPAAAKVSATAVHEAFNQKKDAPMEEAAETQDVKGAETPTTNGHTEEEVAEAPSLEVVNINSLFSNELLEFLLGLLPHRDLKSAVLVCKHLREIGEGPNLWTWVKLLVTSGNLADMPDIICLSRLAKLETITLEAISKEVLQAIKKHQGLKLLDISECNVSDIDSDLLARVITRIEEVRLEYTELNTKQWNDIFNSMSNGAKLKKLNINWMSLSKANPQSMAKAISTLEVVKLVDSGLTSEQSKAMFELLALKSKLKSLEIRRGDLSSVAGKTLAMVVSKVEEATLHYAGLTTEQWTAIFIKAAEESSKLKVLNIGKYGSNGFSQVDANLMATAVNKLEKVDLHLAFLNARQCSAIFGFAAGNSKLKELDISINDLSSVNQYDMAKAVHNMEKINLSSTELTNQQCTQIFNYADGHSNLKVLNIGYNDLHSVEPGSIAKTVSKMEECMLRSSNLTSQQLDAIFKQLSEDSKLKKLDMLGVTVSSVEGNVISKAIANLMEIRSSRKLKILDLRWTDLRSVQIDSLVGAIANLEEVHLSGTHLTTQQLEAVFMEIKSSRKLKILDLSEVNLRSVQIDSLVGALSCLEVVSLEGASLTPEQLAAVKRIREDCRTKVYM